MRTVASWAIALSLVLCAAALAAPRSKVQPIPLPDRLTGMESLPPGAVPAVPRYPGHTLDEDTIIGSRFQAGTTVFDVQQNGTAGKQIAVDCFGQTQCVWTFASTTSFSPRRVYYNSFNPDSNRFMSETGIQTDIAPLRAGFANIAVTREGIGIALFHQVMDQAANVPHSAGGIDYSPGYGAFQVADILPYVPSDAQIIWPHVDVDVDGVVHTVHTNNGGSGHWYYARGVPGYDDEGHGNGIEWPAGFQYLGDPNTFITVDVAAALHSPRVAAAWIYGSTTATNEGNNIYLKISEDGGMNWGETVNMTRFTSVDPECINNGGNIDECNRDTLRPWIDLSLLFDQNDQIHVAFSAWGWYYWLNVDGVDTVGPWNWTDRRSQIWHWTEQYDQFSLVADRWYGASDPSTYSVGSNMLMVNRPSLSLDTVSGNLYCSYQAFDTSQWNNTNYLMSDAWVTVSTSGGRFWAEGTDVTKTDGGQNTAPPGSKSERDIFLSKYVSDNSLHMLYMLDHDAGSFVNDQGTMTVNEMYYLRIPVDSIPTGPLMPVRALHWDSAGFPSAIGDHPTLLPDEFALYQNYPNPFNPSTTIQFDLASPALVNLSVYDVLGRKVASLLDHQTLTAGAHSLNFAASYLASGVYFYCLQTPTHTQTRKMVLMK